MDPDKTYTSEELAKATGKQIHIITEALNCAYKFGLLEKYEGLNKKKIFKTRQLRLDIPK